MDLEFRRKVMEVARIMKWDPEHMGLLRFHARRLGLRRFGAIYEAVRLNCEEKHILYPGPELNRTLHATPTPRWEGGAS